MVALRRTRSLLGLLKEVFPVVRVERFRKEFRWVGAVTGPARDLDVFMLALRPIRDDPGGHISTLRRAVAACRRRAHRAMLGHLDSRRCRTLISALKKLQTSLGDDNDTVVHERLLLDEGRVPAEAHPERAAVLASVGRLVEHLRARRASLRPRVLRQLRRFCSHPVRSDFRHLFKVSPGDQTRSRPHHLQHEGRRRPGPRKPMTSLHRRNGRDAPP